MAKYSFETKTMLWLRTILVLLLCSGTLLITTVSAGPGEYTIEPVPENLEALTSMETILLSFWELPPQVMAVTLAVSIFPVFVFPVELFILIKLVLLLGFRNVRKFTVLNNISRSRIYDCIAKNPGIFFTALSQEPNVKPDSLRYHLNLLQLMGKIAIMRTWGHSRYFENQGKYSDLEKKILKYIQHGTYRRILIVFLTSPDTTRKDLAEKLGIAGSTVTWYTNRMRDENLISVQKAGKNARYDLTPEARRSLTEYLRPGTETIQ